MNLFRKAMLAVVTMILAVVTIVVPANKKATKVEAASTTIYLNTGGSSLWNQAGAIFFVHAWGSTTEDIKMTVTADKDIYKVDINSANTSIIFTRNPSSSTGPWNGTWNQTADLTIPAGKNYYTITGWGSSDGTWGTYSEAAPKHKVTYYDGATVLSTEEKTEGTAYTASYFKEKEGYRFEGWYTNASLTTAYVNGTALKGALNLYAKYVAAEDYVIYVDTSAKSTITKVNAYMWGTKHTNNNTWPGVAAEKVANGLFKVTVDASKTFDKVIFSYGDGDDNQTVDLDLTLVGNTTYVITFKSGAKDTATTHAQPEVTAVIGWQTGVKGEAKALRIVVALTGVTAANIKYLHDAVQISVSYNGQPYVHTVTALFTGVASLGEGEVPAADLYAVLTIEGIPSGEFAIEALIGGEVVATATANA